MKTDLNVNVDKDLAEAWESGKANRFSVGGVFTVTHLRNGEVIDTIHSPNIVVNEGLDYILDAALSNATQETAFYIGIYKNNYTPQATNSMATFAGAGVAGEANSEIDESARQAWTEAGVSSRTITNSASPAEFTANTSVSIYGAFLATDNTLGGTSGTLIAASKFGAVRNLEDDDVLSVTYTLSIADG